MFAYVLKKSSFKTDDVPADLVEKRDKLATRAEKKKEESAKPKMVNKSALAKKIQAQLDGLDLLEKLTPRNLGRAFVVKINQVPLQLRFMVNGDDRRRSPRGAGLGPRPHRQADVARGEALDGHLSTFPAGSSCRAPSACRPRSRASGTGR